ncbi:MAG TPA: WXG100 family type VII secretion target [Ktedonobacteraceae bacterium]|nr:WXG100 family type VII secretion target [Ktedonobacteraceae bacterium]
MSGNGDMIGTRTGEMDATAQNFMQRMQEFEVALNNINNAVAHLESVWSGAGSVAFQGAMQKWNRDATAIHNDLQQLAQGVRNSSQAFSTLDQDMARAFNGF